MGMYAIFQGKEFKAQGLLWTSIKKAGIVYNDGVLEVPSDKINLVARCMYEEITSPAYIKAIKADGLCYIGLYQLQCDISIMVSLYNEEKDQQLSKEFKSLIFS